MSFQVACPGFRLNISTALRPFIARFEPEISFIVHNAPMPIDDMGAAQFDSGGNWALYSWQDRTVLRVRAVGPDTNRPFYVVVLDPDGAQGNFYYEAVNEARSAPVITVLGPPLDEILLVHLLAQGRGLLFHAGGISLNGRGLLFAAASGTGKSTLIETWKQVGEAALLGDERISMRRLAEGFQIYGTPWTSSAGVASPEDAPLEAVFILKQASENRAVSIQPSQAVASLLIRSFPPFWDADGMAFTLEFLDELIQAVPIYELNLLPDPSAVEYVQWMLSQ